MSALRLWIGFIAMCVGLFMAVLDIQVVASALTTIGAALHIAPERLGWIQTGYLMAEVVSIPLTGVLTRALSLRWMFVSATLGFTLASLGCAMATTVSMLIALRVVQGFCGGMLIPAVFTSIFVMMPKEQEILATTLAGVFAMIAPTIGPFVGGYVTKHLSWNWIFLINIVPGLLVSLTVALCVRVGKPDLSAIRRIDYATLVLTAIFLGSLQLLFNEAPGRDWHGIFVYSVAAICLSSGAAGAWCALTRPLPFIDLRSFRRRDFALGCALSFVFGMGLYGSSYILALFLGLVRGHTPLVIGEIMVVSGAAQLLMAPVVALLETKVHCRILIALGFLMFGLGLYTNGLENPHSEFWGLFWPQILRGCAVMLCILPCTRLALEGWSQKDVPEASGSIQSDAQSGRRHRHRAGGHACRDPHRRPCLGLGRQASGRRRHGGAAGGATHRPVPGPQHGTGGSHDPRHRRSHAGARRADPIAQRKLDGADLAVRAGAVSGARRETLIRR